MAQTPEPPSNARPDAVPHRDLPVPLGLVIALVAGISMPSQGRVNGALGASLQDGYAAGLISFLVGLVAIALMAVLLPSGRRGLREVPRAFREKAFPWWYLIAGAIGGYFVVTQGLTVGVLGLAVFTVANVTGQTIGSMVVDTTGFGPGGRRPVTGIRVIGAILMLVAVVWAVSPKLGGSLDHPAQLLLPMLLPFSAGLFNGFQVAMNGVQTHHYGTFIPATLFNFVVGTVALLIVVAIHTAFAGWPQALPHEWWMYLGGPFGVVFIGTSAYLSKHLGVLVTSLGLIGGQLLGSLLLDAVFPAPGTHVAVATVCGTLLAVGAVALASIPPSATMPWERLRR